MKREHQSALREAIEKLERKKKEEEKEKDEIDLYKSV